MLPNEAKKYSTGFTSGALLYNEANKVFVGITSINALLLGEEDINPDLIPTNSEGSRKRLKLELEKRLRAVNDREILEFFRKTDETNKKLILLYAACKLYDLLSEFLLEVVLNKWNNIDFEISTEDFSNFLYRKMGEYDELLSITEKTIYKLSQIAIKMLKELGMVEKGLLKKIEFDSHLLQLIIKNGDMWFLRAMLLKDHEIKELMQYE